MWKLRGLEFFVDLLFKRIEESFVLSSAQEQGSSTPHKRLSRALSGERSASKKELTHLDVISHEGTRAIQSGGIGVV